ncbi:hypothetical protein [Pusillibacter faecalis]|uniref:hypothetical protein n=1 Tax=Pusillibacter faecalis TaxID=2714358 RepID=UPI002943B46E|nr:hypothetical protein [Pusillibacter faecalis]
MFLSVQQRYIQATVRSLRCLRCRQLLMLTQGKYCKIVERHMEPMLRQLRAASNDIRYDGGLVYLSGTTPDSRRLEAIDVMLELTGGKPESFGGAGAPPPLLLRFSWGGTDRRFFTVATLSSPGREHLDYLELGSAARMIWLSDGGTPPAGLVLPKNHFFAARQGDGTHRFYGSSQP